MGPSPPRDPITVLSPSGKTRFWINPSDPSGNGPAFCKVTAGGKLIWQRNLPFTFHQVAISDSGVIGGYAYPKGDGIDGDFVVAIIDEKGRTRLQERTKRQSSPYLHVDSDPKALGLIFDPGNDRMIVRVDDPDVNRNLQTWHEYRLSSARKVAKHQPEAMRSATGEFIHAARPVPGTPLILTNWYVSTGGMGQAFSLLDESMHPIWRLDLPGDFESGAAVEDKFLVRDSAMSSGTILINNQSHRFEIRLVKQGQRVTFNVSQIGGQWIVREVARARFDLAADRVPEAFRPRTIDLEVVRRTTLPHPEDQPSVVRNVGPFDFWGENRLFFLRDEAPRSLCIIDLSGNLIREIRLPKEAQVSETKIFLSKATALSEVLIVATTSSKSGKSVAWKISLDSAEIRPLPKFTAYWTQSIATRLDGNFAVLSLESLSFTMPHHVTFYRPDGSKIWDKNNYAGYGGGDDELLGPEDVDFDTAGNLVVLDNSRHSLQLYDESGTFKRIIDLDSTWGKEASYPTEITCLVGGGYWLYDFGAEKPCYVLDADGRILRNFQPHFASGRSFDTRVEMRTDSDGKAWITNGTSFVQINEAGLGVQVIGNKPKGTGLDTIGDLHVGFDGRIYVLDRATSSVHAFD